MNKLPLKIGITGGIGSGKTFICSLYQQLGIPVFNADTNAKLLMEQNGELKRQITGLLGQNAYDVYGKLNRTVIANKVFHEPELLSRLNSLVHPEVIATGEKWHLEQKSVPFTIKEAALLIESGSYKQLDALIVVSAPEALRIQRVVSRDNVNAEDVTARIQKQLPESEMLKYADFVVQNDGATPVIPQVHQIYRKLMDYLN